MNQLCMPLAHVGIWLTFAALAVWPALLILAIVFALLRVVRKRTRERVIVPAWHALRANVAAAGLVWIVTYCLIGLRVLPHYVNVPRDAHLPDAVTPCTEVLFAQVVPLIVAGLLIAVVRGKYRSITGIIAGLLLLAINIVTIRTRFMTGKLFMVTYLVLHPMVAAVPQWWCPLRKKQESSNKTIVCGE